VTFAILLWSFFVIWDLFRRLPDHALRIGYLLLAIDHSRSAVDGDNKQ